MRCSEFQEQYDLYLDAMRGPSLLSREELAALSAHHESCPRCAQVAADNERFSESVARLLRVPAPRSVPAASVVSIGSQTRDLSVWASVGAALAAAAIALFILRPGLLHGSSSPHGVMAVEDGVSVWLAPNARAAHTKGTLMLESGVVTVSVRPGTPFRVVAGDAEVSVHGTIFSVMRRESMGIWQTMGVAASVSVAVTVGVVSFMNSAGALTLKAGDVASAAAGAESRLRTAADLAEVETRLAQARRQLKEMQAETAGFELSAMIDHAVTKALAARSSDDVSTDEPAIDDAEARASIATLAKLGMRVYGHRDVGLLAAKLKAREDRGAPLVKASLTADTQEERFVAALLAESLDLKAIAPEIEDVATGDESVIVRRMASHAMLTFGDAQALERVFHAERHDVGVRTNAWFGLAEKDPARANALFPELLDAASAEVGPDQLVGMVLSLGKPTVSPSLLIAVRHARVSEATKESVLRHLATSSWAGAPAALKLLANDSKLSPRLKAVLAELGI